MKIAYFECFSGAGGDMILGALLNAGLEQEKLERELHRLSLPAYHLLVKPVKRCGLAGTSVRVIDSKAKVPEGANYKGELITSGHAASGEYTMPRLQEIIRSSGLTSGVKEKAGRILGRLAAAEAQRHGVIPEEVHLHELGAVDTLVDIVGAVAGLELLGVEEVWISAMNVGAGEVITKHGRLPVPAPATLELIRGFQVYSSGGDKELLTPTGAAILTTLAAGQDVFPMMTPDAVGYGAGEYDDPSAPNLLRVSLGEAGTSAVQNLPIQGLDFKEKVAVLETDIDDMNPEFYPWLRERLGDAGAVDVTFMSIFMKKGRPGARVTAICSLDAVSRVSDMLLGESTSLGIRVIQAGRITLERDIQIAETPFGPVRLKIAACGGKITNVAPEFEDCAKLARESGRPIKEVYQAALISAKNINR